MIKILLFLLILVSTKQSFADYNIVDRTRLIEDRLKLQEALRPRGHDFFLDTNAYFSGDIFDLADDLQTAANNTTNGTKTAFESANELVNSWNGKELGGRFNIGAGIPLFQFTAWGIKFIPELVRADFGFTANVGISKEVISPSDFIEMAGDSIDPEIKNALKVIDLNTFTRIAGEADNNNLYDTLKDYATEQNDPVLAAAVEARKTDLQRVELEDQLVTALANSQELPNLDIYLKADLKVGPKIAWSGVNFFGHTSLYGLMRVDVFNRITSATIKNGGSSLDAPTDIEETNLTFDAAFGYRAENYAIIASVEELKIMNFKLASDANNLYGTPSLFKLYGEMNFKPLSFMKLKTFGGFHLREGYSIGKGYYLGADLGAYVWGDRLGIQFRAQLDAEHVTLAPQFKFWVMQLEGMYKLPIASEVDGLKPGSILGVNFRVFI